MYSLFFCSQLLLSFPASSSSSSADLHTHTHKHTHIWHEQEPAFVPLQDPKAWAIIPWIESCISSSSSSSENAMNSNVRWLWIPLNSSALLSSQTNPEQNGWCRCRNGVTHETLAENTTICCMTTTSWSFFLFLYNTASGCFHLPTFSETSTN